MLQQIGNKASEGPLNGAMPARPLVILELFAGTGSFSKIAREHGHRTFTVDYDGRLKPDMVRNILELSVNELPTEFQNPDIVWTSPPCTTFSVASIGCHWDFIGGRYHPKTFDAVQGVKLARKNLELLNELNPKCWTIENPRGLLRKMPFMQGIGKRRTVTYCQYGDTRQKPTDIWSNLYHWQPAPACNCGDPCHEAAPRGSKTGTQGLRGAKDRAVIPPRLCDEILRAMEDYIFNWVHTETTPRRLKSVNPEGVKMTRQEVLI